MKTTVEIDSAIEELRAKAKDLSARLEEKRRKQVDLESQRKALRSKSLRDGDRKATAELAQIRQGLSVAGMEAEDVQSELDAIAKEIEALQAKREEAYRAQKRAERNEGRKRFCGGTAKQISELLETLAGRCGEFYKFMEQDRQLSIEMGEHPPEPGHRHDPMIESLWAMLWRVKPGLGRKPYADMYLKEKFHDIMARFLNQTGETDNTESQEASRAEAGA